MAMVISEGHGFKVGRNGFDGTDTDVDENNEFFRITNSGDVGIGTGNPQAFLHLETPKQTAGWQIRTDSYGLSNESGFYRDVNDDYELVIRNGEGGLSYIKNNGTSSDSNLIFNVGGSEIHINDVGDLIPNANGSQELGSSSKYWEKIYVNAIEGASTITGTIENADKLDGQHGSFYLDTSSTSQTKSGQLIIDTDNQQNGALRILANQTNPSNNQYFAQEIVSTLSGSTATGGDRTQGGIHLDINSTATGGDTSNEHRAYGIFVDLDSTGDSDIVYGVYSDATATPTEGTVSNIVGVFGRAEDNGGAGEVSSIFGVRGLAVSDNSTSDTDNMYGGHFKSQPASDTGNIGAAHGVYAEIEIANNTGDHLGAAYVFRAEYDDNDGVAQTNNSYLYYGNYAGTLPTNAYGVYISDDVPNYFGGSVLAGGPIDANSGAKLQVNGFQRTGTIFLHVGTSPTTTNHALSNNNGTLQWDGNDVLTTANEGSGNGIDADTIDGIDSLELGRRVVTTATGTSSDANYWAKIATFSTGTSQYNDGTIILAVTNEESSTVQTAIISVFFRSNGTNTNPTVSVEILSRSGLTYIKNNSFKVISGGWSTDMQLWMQKGDNYGGFAFYEISKNISSDANVSLTYHDNASWQQATPSGSVNNVVPTSVPPKFSRYSAYNTVLEESGFISYYNITSGSRPHTSSAYWSGIQSVLFDDTRYGWQLIGNSQGGQDAELYVRKIDNNSYPNSGAWTKLLTESDLGGTTIDDKYLRSDIADIAAGKITFEQGTENKGVLEFNSTLETYDPAGGGGSDTSTSAAIALPSGKQIVGYDDGYIRNLLSWSNGSNIVIGQQNTSKIQGIQLKPGNSNAGVKLHYGGTGDNLKFETTSTGAKVTGNLEVTGVLSYDDVTNIDSVGIITARAGIHVSGGNIRFGPGVPANDDAHIEWLGSNNAGYLRISTSDDSGTEYIELGDYASTEASGTFTQWMKLDRSELYMASAVRLNGLFKDKDGDTGSNGQVLVSTGSQVNWVNSSSVGTDTNTTYDLSVPSGTTKIRLDPSDNSGNDDVEIAGGTNITVTRNNGNKLTIATSGTISGTYLFQANQIRIKTATGDEFKNITFVDRDVANNDYDDIKIDANDDTLAYNPSSNTFKTQNINVTGNTQIQGELNFISNTDTNKYIDCRLGNGNALHIRSTAGGILIMKIWQYSNVMVKLLFIMIMQKNSALKVLVPRLLVN